MSKQAKGSVSKNKQLILNMAASLLSCLVSLGIGFLITPAVTSKLGTQANAYVTLANNFVNYAAIAAMALNSMAGRFITVKIHQNDMEGANRYFNSVMYANMVIVGVLLLIGAPVVCFLDQLIHISPALVLDVKLLFAAMFLNFMVTIIATTFSTATFAANRLDLSAMRSIESQLLKAVLLVAAFTLFPVRVQYMGYATLLSNVYLFFTYVYYTKKLLPGIELKRSYFSFATVLEILSSGIWNTIMRTGQALTNQLDVLITNLWIGETESGYIGISTVIVTSINTLYETISAVFTPSLTISYAKENKQELTSDLKSAMKLTGFFANIPLCYVIGFGISFYNMWLKLDAEVTSILYLLTILIMLGTLVGGAISPLFNVYTIVNKLKWNSLVTLLMGVLNALVVFCLLEIPSLRPYGIYFVAGVSSILGIIKNLTFTPMYAAHCLGLSKKTFYPTIFRYMAVTTLMSIVFLLLNQVLRTQSWAMVLFDIVLCGIVGSILNITLLFGKKEREIFFENLKKFLKKKP